MNAEKKSNGLAVLPYVTGVSEALNRTFRKYNISTAMKPHMTLRQLLIHPKDKVESMKRCGVVYSIPCANCENVYIGETGRKLETRLREHQEDVEKNTVGVATRSRRKESATELHKSALTDHAAAHNHIIDWNKTKILDRDSETIKRGIKEAMWIRKTKTLNRDEGRHHLSHAYDALLTANRQGGRPA